METKGPHDNLNILLQKKTMIGATTEETQRQGRRGEAKHREV